MNIDRRTQQGRCDTPHAPAGTPQVRRSSWLDIAPRFTGERECLASYLALEAAEVIGGVKPANLLNLVDLERPCGRNLYRLWRRHGQSILAQSGLAARELVQRADGMLLLIYHPQRLAAYLETPKVANFLRRAGYHQPTDMKETLRELTSRCTIVDGFPHEIGAILGYPLKDVAGFMGWAQLPVTGQGPWKIYGDPRPSFAVIAVCRGCRESMARRLAVCATPLDCLKGEADGQHRNSCSPSK